MLELSESHARQKQSRLQLLKLPLVIVAFFTYDQYAIPKGIDIRQLNGQSLIDKRVVFSFRVWRWLRQEK